MKRIVLGTAGHIDHGKTLLTKALTGVDTDRLAEEKARGITIELGFAPLRLPDGSEISLVDVPGHERFVRTMMSGVAGVDGILLVIAADDGVMPQTQEHFDILRLLGLRHGIVVLTKTDLVSADRLEEVRRQVRELGAGSFLENAPICPVSAITGEGIETLRAEIARLVAVCEERSSERPFRLSIDRAFPVEGFGTVVSGTVTEGSVRVGERVCLYPSGQVCTVRSLQTHGRAEQEALAGMRAAMSFSGLPKDLALRGCTAAEPDSLLVTDLLTVRIEVLQDCPYPIRNSSQLHLFCGTGEVICKLRLLDADVYKAGQSGCAQLRLSAPIPARWGDRFLLRFFSPVVTIGGGVVLACGGGRLRRHDPAVLERLARLEKPEARLLQRIEDAGLTPVSRAALQKYSNLSPAEYAAEEAPLLTDGAAAELLPGSLISTRALAETRQKAQTLLESFHADYPLQSGMGAAEFRSRLFGGAEAPADALLRFFTQNGALCAENGYVHLPDFVPVFTQEHKIMQRKLMHFYREAWLFAPDLQEVKTKFQRFGLLFEQVLANLRIGGQLIPLTPRYWVHFEAYAQALDIFSALAAEGKPVTLAQFRTAAGISRKYSQLFLEYWDRRGITRRVGDAHVLMQKQADE